MRPVMLVSACLACLGSGCGTVANLKDPPSPGKTGEFGTSECSPFGGVTRSAGLAVCGLGSGEALGIGVGLVGLVDTPLSLAGDVVTLPIALARHQGASWAT